MGKKEKEAIINSFIYSNFNYCPLLWYFCLCKSSNKIEQIQKCCLRIILNDNECDYEALLKKSSKTTINVFNLNPFLKEIRSNDITVKNHNNATYGDKFLTKQGPKIWNSLPENVKSEKSYRRFNEYILIVIEDIMKVLLHLF